MQGTTTNTRRKIIAARNGVVSGSVWENRMKIDQVKGGIKVFNGSKSCNDDVDNNGNDSNVDEEGTRVYQRLRRDQSDSFVPGKKKRMNWTLPANEVLAGKSPIQLRKARSELSRNSPRLRAMKSLEFTAEKKPMLVITDGNDKMGEVDDEMEDDVNSFEDKEMDLSTVKEPKNVEEKTVHGIDDITEDEMHNSVVVLSKEVEMQQNPSIVSSVEVGKNQNSEVVLSIVAEEKNQNSVILSPLLAEIFLNPVIISSVAVEKKLNHVISSSVTIEKKQNSFIASSVTVERKPNPDTEPTADTKRKEIPQMPCRRMDLDSPKLHPASEVHEQVFPDATLDCPNRMKTIVDLIMWRDVSKSAFAFGLGTFTLISSSYTNDINFSLISATSYAALIYLALIFTYKSILHRVECTEEYEESDESYIVGEEEVIGIIRKVLPYINELLVSLKALFSGDPATTMKLAVTLFVLARCGKSITIWSLIKLVFFGVFTIPKVCSSYSDQLTKYGKFWLNRLRDGWESCTHKKAVAVGIFTIIWNISSTVARIWALFMLVVAFKLYKQYGGENWANEELQEETVVDEIREEDSKPIHSPINDLNRRQRGGTTRTGVVQQRKVKKWQ